MGCPDLTQIHHRMGNLYIWVLFVFFFFQSSCLGFYLRDNYPHKHVVSDPLSVKVNSITSIDTKMPFSYYSLSFCKPQEGVKDSAENRGELLMGDRIENSPYRFKTYTNETDIFFCKTDPLSKDNFELLKRRIDEMYQFIGFCFWDGYDQENALDLASNHAQLNISISNLNNSTNSEVGYGSFHGREFGFVGGNSRTHLVNSKPKESPSIRCQSTGTNEPKTRRNLLDNASNLLTNLLSGGSLGSMPVAEGAVSDLFGRPLFFSLYDWFIEHGSVYKLAFGPKAFVVVSDPIIARHILRENAFSYDKGVLAEILEPIMGKGLIPADLDTWKQRRRVIAPGFHALYLEAMVNMFADCSERTIMKFEKLLEGEDSRGGNSIELDLEAEFSSLALDIIGLGVFNYDFGSVTKESPVIKAVYGTLFEAEHRSTFYIPYWKIPLARWIVPRQRKFQNDLKIINDCLDGLIRNAKETRQETDVEKLQSRDYSNLKDASLLRFLVDMRGADVDDRQLRDDLMTMLIAGHETTAAVLTWAVFLLAQNPSKVKKAQAEVDSVLGQKKPTFESLKKLEYIRLIVAESLRLYPQPPLLIRRTIKPDVLPGGYRGDKDGYPVPAGTDIFLSIYNLHRSPYFWDRPHEFEPERFLKPRKDVGIEGWSGFDPSRSPGALYPNEIVSDYAFLGFGGGPRKCVGDQFAVMESTVGLAMLLQKFDIELKGSPESVELVTGATIHTKNGLWCKLRERSAVH